MTPDEVRNLLGGYATGTLTDAERASLFEAALHDEQLFAALADEQALKEMLESSTARAQLLAATEEPRFSVRGALREWFEKPMAKGLVATGMVLVVAIAVQSVREQRQDLPLAETRTEAPASTRPAVPASPVMVSPSKPLRAKQAVPVKLREAAPAQIAEGAAPPASAPALPAMIAPLARTAQAGSASVEYKLLAQDGAVFRPVSLEEPVDANVPLQLQLTPNRVGMLMVTASNGRGLLSRSVMEGEVVTVPLGAIASGDLHVYFTQGSLGGVAMRAFSESEFRAKSSATTANDIAPSSSELSFKINIQRK